jgi:hypothetical protein
LEALGDQTLNPIPEESVAVFAAPQFIVVSLLVGALVEALKRGFVASAPAVMETRAAKVAMPVLPVVIGAVLGWLIIPADGPVHPAALGVVAGSFAASTYQTVRHMFPGGRDDSQPPNP